MSDRDDPERIFQQTMAETLCCSQGDFEGERVTVVEARPSHSGFRYRFWEPHLDVVSFGRGAVVSATGPYLAWARKEAVHLRPGRVVAPRALGRMQEIAETCGQAIAGIDHRFVCPHDRIVLPETEGFVCRVCEGDAIFPLYEHEGYRNALQYDRASGRRDVLAVVATRGSEIAGIAGASTDSERMWQIGIDVQPAFRRRGVGRLLVATLTKHVYEHGRVPYYSTGSANMASRRLAVSVGFRPCCLEVYARDRESM